MSSRFLQLVCKKDNIADRNGHAVGSNLARRPALSTGAAEGVLHVPRQSDLKAKTQKPLPADENNLEGRQDMGGKQGGQAGFPKPTPRPRTTSRDEDVTVKRDGRQSTT